MPKNRGAPPKEGKKRNKEEEEKNERNWLATKVGSKKANE